MIIINKAEVTNALNQYLNFYRNRSTQVDYAEAATRKNWFLQVYRKGVFSGKLPADAYSLVTSIELGSGESDDADPFALFKSPNSADVITDKPVIGPTYTSMPLSKEFIQYDLPRWKAMRDSATPLEVHFVDVTAMITDLVSIYDWMRGTQNADIPNDITRLSVDVAMVKATAWHAIEAARRQAVYAERNVEQNEGDRYVLSTVDIIDVSPDIRNHKPWTLTVLLDEAALEHESWLMNHCVGWDSQNYKQRVKEGVCVILHADDGQTHYTLELVATDHEPYFEIVQMCGAGNARPQGDDKVIVGATIAAQFDKIKDNFARRRYTPKE